MEMTNFQISDYVDNPHNLAFYFRIVTQYAQRNTN